MDRRQRVRHDAVLTKSTTREFSALRPSDDQALGGTMAFAPRAAVNSCPLCAQEELRLVETIDCSLLNRAWRKAFHVELAVGVDLIDYIECRACGLRYFEPMEAGGPELYAELERHDWYYMAHKPEFDLALPYLSGCKSVLESGAGTGAFAAHLDGRRYVGLDFNESGVATGRAAGVQLLNESVSEHASGADRYEAVVAFQTLEHVPDPLGFLADSRACLIPGGRLIVAVPSADGFLRDAINVLLNAPPHHVSQWPDRTFEAVASLLDLDLIAIVHEPVASFHETWARSIRLENRIRERIGLRPRLMDFRPVARVAGRVARLLARLDRSSLEGVLGHTVVAVFEVPDA
jgi:SAM-dependent methyltransferase